LIGASQILLLPLSLLPLLQSSLLSLLLPLPLLQALLLFLSALLLYLLLLLLLSPPLTLSLPQQLIDILLTPRFGMSVSTQKTFAFCRLFLILLAMSTLASSATPQPALEATNVRQALHFHGMYSQDSDSFPANRKQDLVDFLRERQNVFSLFNMNGKREAVMEDLTEETVSMWNKVCDEKFSDSDRPTPADCAFVSKTEIAFPGLKLKTRSLNGLKIKEVNGMPEVRGYLLGEQQDLEGLSPVKWIFNKITGYDLRPKGVFSKTDARVKHHATICDVDGGKVCFRYEIEFDILLDLPSSVLKVMPMSREKMEHQGGTSILKTVKEDVNEAVKSLIDTFKSTRLVRVPA
jgi:hypothetical protein